MDLQFYSGQLNVFTGGHCYWLYLSNDDLNLQLKTALYAGFWEVEDNLRPFPTARQMLWTKYTFLSFQGEK